MSKLPFDLDIFFGDCMALSEVKSKGYTGDKAQCFNFVMVELLSEIPAWKAVSLVRLTDKMCRRVSFATTTSEVPDDSFKDCCRDTANYAGIEYWLYQNRHLITNLCQAFRYGLSSIEQEQEKTNENIPCS